MLSSYKTSKKFGTRRTQIPESLETAVDEFVGSHRPLLLQGLEQHNAVFVNSVGAAFSAPRWSDYVQEIMESVCDRRIGVNLLRDSFVTHLQQNSPGQDSLKRSAAEAMGHSSKMQRRVYDRRTGDEKRLESVRYAAQLVEELETESDVGSSRLASQRLLVYSDSDSGHKPAATVSNVSDERVCETTESVAADSSGLEAVVGIRSIDPMLK